MVLPVGILVLYEYTCSGSYLDQSYRAKTVNEPETDPIPPTHPRSANANPIPWDVGHGSYMYIRRVGRWMPTAAQSINCMTPNSSRSIARSRPFVILYVRIHTPYPTNRVQHVAPGQWVQAPGCGRQLCAGWDSQAMPNGERVAILRFPTLTRSSILDSS